MIKVMLNDKEIEHLNKQLETSGLNRSTLVRKLIMGLKINPAPVDEYRRTCALLSNATNNLNQIARHSNATGCIEDEKLDVAVMLIRKCWQQFRELR
jgi:hypothetical protein